MCPKVSKTEVYGHLRLPTYMYVYKWVEVSRGVWTQTTPGASTGVQMRLHVSRDFERYINTADSRHPHVSTQKCHRY